MKTKIYNSTFQQGILKAPDIYIKDIPPLYLDESNQPLVDELNKDFVLVNHFAFKALHIALDPIQLFYCEHNAKNNEFPRVISIKDIIFPNLPNPYQSSLVCIPKEHWKVLSTELHFLSGYNKLQKVYWQAVHQEVPFYINTVNEPVNLHLFSIEGNFGTFHFKQLIPETGNNYQYRLCFDLTVSNSVMRIANAMFPQKGK